MRTHNIFRHGISFKNAKNANDYTRSLQIKKQDQNLPRQEEFEDHEE